MDQAANHGRGKTVKVRETDLPEVLIVSPRIFRDERGFFMEAFHKKKFADVGLVTEFVQDNHSRSRHGVLRGLHYQLGSPQGKLVHCIRGSIFDVAVDIRIGSPNFGKWTAAVLDDISLEALWVPPGFAHGFCVLSEEADVVYKATDFYAPATERGLIWNDPSIKIEWPIALPKLSPRDAAFPTLDVAGRDLPHYHVSSR
jgi:dTDP-4-dehydrorhamnose 3,5-epimerase